MIFGDYIFEGQVPIASKVRGIVAQLAFALAFVEALKTLSLIASKRAKYKQIEMEIIIHGFLYLKFEGQFLLVFQVRSRHCCSVGLGLQEALKTLTSISYKRGKIWKDRYGAHYTWVP